jgi:type II secretory pathway pseudopilin PulG
MNATPIGIAPRKTRKAFTLVELMVATAVGVALSGTVVLMLVQSATEQRNGFSDTTVEEKAYTLEANITSCLRSMSADYGITPNYASIVTGTNGNPLEYTSISMFYPTNGTYIVASISYNATNGQVLYTPNVSTPWAHVLWMTNSTSIALTEFYFSTSLNLDGSQNNSLVNVVFQMNDNGFSQQNPTNNPASIFRNFSVQMRNDY